MWKRILLSVEYLNNRRPRAFSFLWSLQLLISLSLLSAVCRLPSLLCTSRCGSDWRKSPNECTREGTRDNPKCPLFNEEMLLEPAERARLRQQAAPQAPAPAQAAQVPQRQAPVLPLYQAPVPPQQRQNAQPAIRGRRAPIPRGPHEGEFFSFVILSTLLSLLKFKLSFVPSLSYSISFSNSISFRISVDSTGCHCHNDFYYLTEGELEQSHTQLERVSSSC